MENAVVLLHTAIAIAIVIGLIVGLRLNPVVGLVIGTIYLGVATGLGLVRTVEVISEGFGELLAAIGLPIGFGVMLGSLLAASGGVKQIAISVLRLVRRERSPYALGATSLVISTPVFYDVAYVILAPLAQSFAVRTGVTIAAMGAAMSLGLGAANLFIPPTPGPLAVAELLGVPVGTMFIYGVVVAVPSALLALFVYNLLLARGFWNPDNDEEEFKEVKEELAREEDDEASLPSLGISLVPILVPIFLILLGTIAGTVGVESGFIDFLGSRITALLLGLLAAYLVAYRYLSRDRFDEAANDGLRASGLILLITGAGGSLGAMLSEVGTGEVLEQLFSGSTLAPILLVWGVGALLRVAQGSGTVAIITAAGLVAPTAATLDVSAPVLALAAFAGALFGGHVNDSGFWVSTKLLGLSTLGGFKIYTVPQSIAAVIALPIILLLGLFA